jgi:hypothetical protein
MDAGMMWLQMNLISSLRTYIRYTSIHRHAAEKQIEPISLSLIILRLDLSLILPDLRKWILREEMKFSAIRN